MSRICPGRGVVLAIYEGYGEASVGACFPVERKRGPAWYAKYRRPDGRQVQKKLGPAWARRGRPTAGYFTKRLAEDWLRETLSEARRGALPGTVRSGTTFADAAAEWVRYVSEDRDVKPSTLTGYRSEVALRLLPEFGSVPIEDLTPSLIEHWRVGLGALVGGSPGTIPST